MKKKLRVYIRGAYIRGSLYPRSLLPAGFNVEFFATGTNSFL